MTERRKTDIITIHYCEVKTMRKLPALLLACMLCLLFVCPSAGAARSGSGTLVSGDYEYTLQDNGTAVITRYTGEADVVVIDRKSVV